MFSRFFINRPIFASVLSIVITLAGSIALFTLPVAQYPEIAPPTVEVSASYPGANAQVVADTVAAPIEQQVNGVEGMMYMSSQCTNDGNYTLTVTFQPGDELSRLPGVGDITYLGQRNYSMRLWLDPQKLASYGLNAQDVIQAVEAQNIQVAAGQIGQPPTPAGKVSQYIITTLGRLENTDPFANI